MSLRNSGGKLLGLVALAAATTAHAQGEPQVIYEFDHNHAKTDPQRGDFGETYVFGGFRFRWNPLDLEIRGQNFLLWTDREATAQLLRQSQTGGSGGPPRRGMDAPSPRRQLTPEIMHQRLAQLLGALGQNAPAPDPEELAGAELPRFLYFEGDVVVISDGVEVARCKRLWISPQDNRIVIEGAELRYRSVKGNRGEQLVIVRGDRIVKQGGRWTGRDLQVTSCDAGKPHIAVASGELEIIERDGQFEIFSRGNRLQLGGTSVMPLPNAHFFTGEQNQIPLKGASAGYSQKEGVSTRIELGMPWNTTGGTLHELFTGRPAEEFRGDWRLGLGWIEERGFPIDGEISYRATDSNGNTIYEGETEAFHLDDHGTNIQAIVNNINGTPITDTDRKLVRTRNRVRFGPRTHVDLSSFYAGDPAVYSEFFRGEYRDAKRPETSIYLHHGSANMLFTLNGQLNLADFSYQSDRALAPFFAEELPVATFNLISQPIGTTPWDTPIVLDTATNAGLRRRDFDPLYSPPPPGTLEPDPYIPPPPATTDPDTTFRFDQQAEVSAPFHLGALNIRPFSSARFTWYDEDADGEEANRWALAGGVDVGTRMSRTWYWLDAGGNQQSLRHVVVPFVTYENRFFVDGEAEEFRQFDDVDALTESSLLRFEVRNLVQRMGDRLPSPFPATRSTNPFEKALIPSPNDVVRVDVAQDFWPNASRDNDGEQLGLFYYDVLVRPNNELLPFPSLAFAVNGQQDWETGMRSFDSEISFGQLLGADWQVEFRRDAVVKGALGLGARTRFLGRWASYANVVYGFEEEEWRSYQFGLRRNDHDWSMMLSLNYDPYSEEVSFRLMFEPRIGGLTPLRERNFPVDQFGRDRNAIYY